MSDIFDTLIIGAGPSGIACSIALHQQGKKVALISKGAPGGKVNIAPRVDNYPREHQIPGPDLAYKFFERMIASGVKFINNEVISLTKEEYFVVKTNKESYLSKSVYIATGTLERKLGLDREDELLGHGVSYCALCDVHFFKGQDILVCGGGNSALKEAIYLSGVAKHLTLIHRRNEFRGSTHIVDELKSKENVTILTPYVPTEIIGEEHVEGIKIKKVDTGEEQIIPVQGFFPLVGQIPSSQFINIPGVVDESGTIPVDKTMMSHEDGLFAGGDILPREIRQIYLAEHDGMVAAKNIIDYLNK